jgi:hypothetical protein
MAIQRGSLMRWGALLLSLLLASCSWLHQAPVPIIKGIPLEGSSVLQNTTTETVPIVSDMSDNASSENSTN